VVYHVLIAYSVEEYIRGIESLSDEAKRNVVEGCLEDLATRADHFLERYPLQHESYLFEYEFALIEGDLVYSFRFIVDGSRMEMGVVQVVYVDHETLSEPS
jgi:hypothetical protein